VTKDERAPEIFVDADACPVKDEVYKVARRYRLKVHVVANAYLNVPREPLISLAVVDAGPDAADDWIAERIRQGDICITADIPLAERCLQAGAAVLDPRGGRFTADSIGMAVAQRALMDQLRSTGAIIGGPKPFTPADRSRFLGTLDEAVHRARRGR
jgi:uncharacterized protein YaiI (UPF0178 family)